MISPLSSMPGPMQPAAVHCVAHSEIQDHLTPAGEFGPHHWIFDSDTQRIASVTMGSVATLLDRLRPIGQPGRRRRDDHDPAVPAGREARQVPTTDDRAVPISGRSRLGSVSGSVGNRRDARLAVAGEEPSPSRAMRGTRFLSVAGSRQRGNRRERTFPLSRKIRDGVRNHIRAAGSRLAGGRPNHRHHAVSPFRARHARPRGGTLITMWEPVGVCAERPGRAVR
jgi:hypothetical protein